MTQKEVKHLNSNYASSSSTDNIGLLVEVTFYELKVRIRTEKLLINQVNLIKKLSQDPEVKKEYLLCIQYFSKGEALLEIKL